MHLLTARVSPPPHPPSTQRLWSSLSPAAVHAMLTVRGSNAAVAQEVHAYEASAPRADARLSDEQQAALRAAWALFPRYVCLAAWPGGWGAKDSRLGFRGQWRAVATPAGRERMVLPTLQTLQDSILLLPWLCFRAAAAAFQTRDRLPS
jgi:hypothetical protein